MRNLIFSVLLGIFVISIFLPFFTVGPISWITGFFYIIYDSILLCFVAYKVKGFLNQGKVQTPASSNSNLTVCILIAAKNEKSIFAKCLNNIANQVRHPDQIIIVDDGSTDGSFETLNNYFNLKWNGKLWQSAKNPKYFVLKKENTGKARSLNEALKFVTTDIVITLDADTFVKGNAVNELINEFKKNSNLQIVGGTLRPSCKKSFMGSVFKTFQKFEYIRSFLSRQAWASTDCLLLVSGAFAAYKTKILKDVGGFDPESFVEDYELTHKIYKYCYDLGIPIHVGVAPKAFAETDCPDTFRKFLRQRQRWFGGFLQTIYKYRIMIGNAQYKSVGRIMLPIKLIDTLQPLYGLVSLYALATIFIFDRKIHAAIVVALVFKIVLDYVYHLYGLYLFTKWQQQDVPKSFWVQSVMVTLLEPIIFQPLRHLGAFMGWIAFLRNKNEWTAQRDSQLIELNENRKAI